ncbi:hypothetical protein [Alishewanella tabrizica]|uniref:Uncharacterized protein n=1 Tax=Alishewanella tabrizica TaxID=671278 RepID=A0ABQ2WNG9_9ALTE|nr:hypothetical protein [Alishewanella tabrizica]GGW59509.1 hypothetical protein GCM10008111_14500 [Alishewanella tabrizica]
MKEWIEMYAMIEPELAVILLNATLLVLAYFWFYPRVAGANLQKVALFDVLTTAIALLIVGVKFWGSDYAFELLSFHFNWFWFTLLTYLVLEIPLSFWYLKRYRQ